MGEPAEPTLDEREKRQQLALIEVDAVRQDLTSPFERELEKFRLAYSDAVRYGERDTINHTVVTAAQDKADDAAEDMKLMFFGLAQEVEYLLAEKRALQAEIDAAHRLLAERARARP